MRRLLACVAGVTVLVSGCGQLDVNQPPGAGAGSGAGSTKEFEARAAVVAATWASTAASGVWKTGLVPLQELTIAPTGGFPNDEIKQAYAAGIYTMLFPLPATESTGVVTFQDGSSLRVPVIAARAAYGALDQGDPTCGPPSRATVPKGPPTASTPDTTAAEPQPPPEQSAPDQPQQSAPDQPQPQQSAPDQPQPEQSAPGQSGPQTPLSAQTPPPPPTDLPLPGPSVSAPGPTEQDGDAMTTSTVMPGLCIDLKVAKAVLKTTQIRTSRGEATVPAWHFTVVGMKEPIVRVAVDERSVVPMPDISMPKTPTSPSMAGAQTFEGVTGRSLRFTLGVGSCDKDIVARVWESSAVVVVGGRLTPPPQDQVCNAMLRLAPVSVQLESPLGDRVVLDVATGRPLVLGAR